MQRSPYPRRVVRARPGHRDGWVSGWAAAYVDGEQPEPETFEQSEEPRAEPRPQVAARPVSPAPARMKTVTVSPEIAKAAAAMQRVRRKGAELLGYRSAAGAHLWRALGFAAVSLLPPLHWLVVVAVIYAGASMVCYARFAFLELR
jgi:hypothetical protein